MDRFRKQKAAIVFIGLAVLISARLMMNGAVSNEDAAAVWEPVSGIAMPDIAAMGFDPNGLIGAAVSSDGLQAVTRDGGRNWMHEEKVPLGTGELVTAVRVSEDGSVTICAGVDESPYTALYRKEGGEWKLRSGNYGGIGGASADGEILVGGGGLFARRQGDDWIFSRLPECGRVMLYAAARDQEKIIAAGDYGVILISSDEGRSWNCSNVSESTLYSAAISNGAGLVGGSGGSLLRYSNGEWKAVGALTEKQAVFALLLDDDGKEGFAAGGKETGEQPFILHTQDGGKSWSAERIAAKGRIAALAKGKNVVFAATMDGRIFARRTTAQTIN